MSRKRWWRNPTVRWPWRNICYSLMSIGVSSNNGEQVKISLENYVTLFLLRRENLNIQFFESFFETTPHHCKL